MRQAVVPEAGQVDFDTVTLRPCGFDEVETLALVGAATFLEAFAGTMDGASIVAHCLRNHSPEFYAKALTAPGCRAWVAEASSGRAPVGYLMLAKPDLPIQLHEHDVELKRVYLFSRFHGHGQLLMDQAISGARALGGMRLLLGVYQGNSRALAFYRRNGFEQVGVRQFRVGDIVHDDFVLALAI